MLLKITSLGVRFKKDKNLDCSLSQKEIEEFLPWNNKPAKKFPRFVVWLIVRKTCNSES